MNKTEILLKRIEKSDFLLRQIIDDYKRRLTFIKEVPGDGNGSNLDIKRNERLRTKASEYRTFISELERIESDLSSLKALEGEEVSDEQINYKAKYEKCIGIIKKFDAGIIGMYDL